MLGMFIQRIPFFGGLFRRGVPDAFAEAPTPSVGHYISEALHGHDGG
jgi:hypothetical protein